MTTYDKIPTLVGVQRITSHIAVTEMFNPDHQNIIWYEPGFALSAITLRWNGHTYEFSWYVIGEMEISIVNPATGSRDVLLHAEDIWKYFAANNITKDDDFEMMDEDELQKYFDVNRSIYNGGLKKFTIFVHSLPYVKFAIERTEGGPRRLRYFEELYIITDKKYEKIPSICNECFTERALLDKLFFAQSDHVKLYGSRRGM